jgi:hypothetical protein
VSKTSTEEALDSASVNYRDILAEFTLPASMGGGLAEAAVAYKYEEYAAALAGPALTLVKNTEELENGFEQFRDAMIAAFEADAARAGLSDADKASIIAALRDARTTSQLVAVLTGDAINAIVMRSGEKARELVDSMKEAEERQQRVEQARQELNRMYDGIFSTEGLEGEELERMQEKRRRVDELTERMLNGTITQAERTELEEIVGDAAYDTDLCQQGVVGSPTPAQSARADAAAADARDLVNSIIAETAAPPTVGASNQNAPIVNGAALLELDRPVQQVAYFNPDDRNQINLPNSTDSLRAVTANPNSGASALISV